MVSRDSTKNEWDFWNVHDGFLSLNVRLSDMLQEVADWANQQGHEKEIILLTVSAAPTVQQLN